MATKRIDTKCTKCGQPMKLPEHVVALPCDARLCAKCTRALLRSSLRVLEQAGMFAPPQAQATTITLPNGTVLAVGDECLAGHPSTLRFRRATIVGVVQKLGEQYARVRGRNGEEWEVIRHGLKQAQATTGV